MKIAVIAGTGVARPPDESGCRVVETPYGRAYVSDSWFGPHSVVLLARHGPGLSVPPHLINYRANIWALKEMGVQAVIATFAVGSLLRDLAPGTLALVTDFVDLTKTRPFTLFESTAVHTDFTVPYCPSITAALGDSGREAGLGEMRTVTYACVEGPRYETPAEIRMIAALGGEVVGMTGVPEVVLAREMGLCYGGLAIVSNYAAGISPAPLSHIEVLASVSDQAQTVDDLLARAIALLEIRGSCANCGPPRT